MSAPGRFGPKWGFMFKHIGVHMGAESKQEEEYVLVRLKDLFKNELSLDYVILVNVFEVSSANACSTMVFPDEKTESFSTSNSVLLDVAL